MLDKNIDIIESFNSNEENINSLLEPESSDNLSIKETFDATIAIERISEDEIIKKKRPKKDKKSLKLIESSNNNTSNNLSKIMNDKEKAENNIVNITEIPKEISDMVASSIEALLFASDEPTPIKLLSEILSEFYRDSKKDEVLPFLKPDTLRVVIDNLNKGYSDRNQSFHIIEIAGGFQFATLQKHAKCLGILFKEKSKRRLSQSALETLAIIAFKQPISKPDIENIRGVNSDYILGTLLEKDLVAITGRADSVGRPLLYGTTSKFLKHFGLKDFKDMPKLKEVEEIMNSEEFKFEVKRLEDSLNKSENIESTESAEDEISPEVVSSTKEAVSTEESTLANEIASDTLLTEESNLEHISNDDVDVAINIVENDSMLENIPIIVDGPIRVQFAEETIEDSSPDDNIPETEIIHNSHEVSSTPENFDSLDTLDDVKKKAFNEEKVESNDSTAFSDNIPFDTSTQSSDTVIDEITQELIENESFVNFQNNPLEKNDLNEPIEEETEENLFFEEDTTEPDIEQTISAEGTDIVESFEKDDDSVEPTNEEQPQFEYFSEKEINKINSTEIIDNIATEDNHVMALTDDNIVNSETLFVEAESSTTEDEPISDTEIFNDKETITEVVTSESETTIETEHITNDADVLEDYSVYVLEGSPILAFQNFSYDESVTTNIEEAINSDTIVEQFVEQPVGKEQETEFTQNESEKTETEEATNSDTAVEQFEEQPVDEKQETEFTQNEIEKPLFEEWKFDYFVETEMFETQTIESDNIFNDIKFNPPDTEMNSKSSDIVVDQKPAEREQEVADTQEVKIKTPDIEEVVLQSTEEERKDVLPSIELSEAPEEEFTHTEGEIMQDKYLDFSPKKNKIDNENLFLEENVLEEPNKVESVTEQEKSFKKISFFTKFKLVITKLLYKIKKFFYR